VDVLCSVSAHTAVFLNTCGSIPFGAQLGRSEDSSTIFTSPSKPSFN
jgi:hypothetical protein